MELFSIAVVLFVSVLLILNLGSRRPKNFPPGPRGLPIIGNVLLFLVKKPHEKMHELKQKYGSVTGLFFATKRMVILNDWVAVKEAFIKKGSIFAGRDKSAYLVHFVKGRGNRVCPGEQLAKLELFLFFATILQNYRVAFSKETPNPDLSDGTFGGVHFAPKHSLDFNKRS